MKVLQVNAVNGISSTGRTCLELSDYLNNHGHQCYTAFSTQRETHHSFRFAYFPENKAHALLSRVCGKQGYFSPLSTKKLIHWISANQPDVVHLRNLHANCIVLNELLQYLAEKDIPTVITLHDCWFFTGGCCHYSSIDCLKWETGCFDCPKRKELGWFFDQSKKVWEDKCKWFMSIPRLAVVGVSKWTKNEARKSPMFKNAALIDYVYNWVNTSVFRTIGSNMVKKRIGAEDKRIILGVASGWGTSKGISKWTELCEKLPAEYVAVLVGDMTGEKKPENLISIPATNNVNELVEYYNSADVLVQFSEEETFGKVVAESLSCGTPVITNNKTANPELIGPNCGAICDNSSDAVIDALKRIKKNDECMTACRGFALANFSMEKNIKKYLSIYDKIIHRSRDKC